MSTPISQLIEISNAYCAATGKTRVAVSKRVFNDGKVIDKLLTGGDLRTSRHQMAVRWFSENWPDGTPWPSHIDRPKPAPDAAA
ncbi:MAG: hypothetical protein ABFD96_05785 [Armatimonadia bacterium]